MHLYQGTSEQFIADAVQARLANPAERPLLRGVPLPPRAVRGQRRGGTRCGAMANVLPLADLTEQGILVEMKLPLTSQRLDVMITGSTQSPAMPR